MTPTPDTHGHTGGDLQPISVALQRLITRLADLAAGDGDQDEGDA